MATKAGIIVFEVKDYSGWIFGSEKNSHWTQVLAYGDEKYMLYNPIKQNNGHIEALKQQLRKEKVPFYSVVVFYGNCELKKIDFIPNGRTFITRPYNVLGVVNSIINNYKSADYFDKANVVTVLKTAVKNGGNIETRNQHANYVESLKLTEFNN